MLARETALVDEGLSIWRRMPYYAFAVPAPLVSRQTTPSFSSALSASQTNGNTVLSFSRPLTGSGHDISTTGATGTNMVSCRSANDCLDDKADASSASSPTPVYGSTGVGSDGVGYWSQLPVRPTPVLRRHLRGFQPTTLGNRQCFASAGVPVSFHLSGVTSGITNEVKKCVDCGCGCQ